LNYCRGYGISHQKHSHGLSFRS